MGRHTGRGIQLELAGDIDAAVARVTPLGEVTRTGSAIRVVPHGAFGPVIAAIEEGGASITRIESHEANLEAVFLALTGRELRDER